MEVVSAMAGTSTCMDKDGHMTVFCAGHLVQLMRPGID